MAVRSGQNRQTQDIADAAAHYGVPAPLLYGVWGAESAFGKNKGPSSAGALGDFQFMPGTARSLGVNLGNFRSEAFGAAKYLSQLRKGSGSWSEAVGKYNAGPAGNLNNPETRAYIPRVLSLAKGWRGPSGSVGGGGASAGSVGPPGLSVSGSSGTQLAAALTQLLQPQQKPVIPSVGLQAPSFAAKPVLAGAPVAQSGPMVPQPSSGDLSGALSLIQGLSGPTARVTAGTRSGGQGAPGGGGRGGKIIVAAGAERPGVFLQSGIKGLLHATSGILGAPLTVTTGTNHNKYVAGEPGVVSDHWAGNAADIGVPVDSHQGDAIAAAALEALGVAPAKARAEAQKGGVFTITRNGQRAQVLWKTMVGGNHHNHVHIGLAPA